MGKFLIAVIGIVLFIYALFDLIATDSRQIKLLPKPVWFVVLLLVPIGPLLWIFLGHTRTAPPPPSTGGGWSRPPGPRGPDDDPDYLRGL